MDMDKLWVAPQTLVMTDLSLGRRPFCDKKKNENKIHIRLDSLSHICICKVKQALVSLKNHGLTVQFRCCMKSVDAIS